MFCPLMLIMLIAWLVYMREGWLKVHARVSACRRESGYCEFYPPPKYKLASYGRNADSSELGYQKCYTSDHFSVRWMLYVCWLKCVLLFTKACSYTSGNWPSVHVLIFKLWFFFLFRSLSRPELKNYCLKPEAVEASPVQWQCHGWQYTLTPKRLLSFHHPSGAVVKYLLALSPKDC